MNTMIEQQAQNLRFSIFPSGYIDKKDNKIKPRQTPQQTQTIEWVYQYISSDRARGFTEELRRMVEEAAGLEEAAAKKEENRQQDFKKQYFEYATFSGIFYYRNACCLVERTPYLTLDIDHLHSAEEVMELKQRFCSDPRVETALCFVSPRGHGVKWIIELPEWAEGLPFKKQFEAMRRYVGFHYGVDLDTSGSDVCRACYLGWDPQCYVNPKYLQIT